MKLLLVVMLGLVALATTTAQDSEDFTVLDDDAEPDDLDIDELEELEKSGKPKELLKELLNSKDSESSLSRTKGVPEAYTNAAASGKAMFDENSASNTEVDDADSNGNDAHSTAVGQRGKRQTPTQLNYCPHRNYLLRWFYLRIGATITDYCYVPWATSQAITYAGCTQRYCLRNSSRRGCCRPTCYQRRRVLVRCYNFRRQRWYWRWVVRNLPQACGCSWCPWFVSRG